MPYLTLLVPLIVSREEGCTVVAGGEHPRVIQHRLGHSTARLSLELYAHVSETADRDAAAHLNDLFTITRESLAESSGGD